MSKKTTDHHSGGGRVTRNTTTTYSDGSSKTTTSSGTKDVFGSFSGKVTSETKTDRHGNSYTKRR